MFRGIALVSAGALALSALAIPAASAAEAPVTGTLSCTLSGTATVKPGLPYFPIDFAVKRPSKTKVTFSAVASNCTGTQSGTKDGLAIQGGMIKSKGTIVTPVGQALPSCASIAFPGPGVAPITFTSKTNWTSTGPRGRAKTVAKSATVMTLGSATVSDVISFDASGTVQEGAFAGQNVTVHVVLDLELYELADACFGPGGLTTLAFTGVNGASTLTTS